MSFSSAAFAVVARVFQLLDADGFIRMLWSKVTVNVPQNFDGYGFEYNDPNWTTNTRASRLVFGRDVTPEVDEASAYLASQLDNVTYSAIKIRSVVRTGYELLGAFMQNSKASVAQASLGTQVNTDPLNPIAAISLSTVQLSPPFTNASIDVIVNHVGSTSQVDVTSQQFNWNNKTMPRGIIGFATGGGADVAFGAGTHDIAGASVTFTAQADRHYKTTAVVNVSKTVANGFVQALIRTGANVLIVQQSEGPLLVNDIATLTVQWVETGLVGLVTRKLSISPSVNGITYIGSFGRNATIIVEDVGAP